MEFSAQAHFEEDGALVRLEDDLPFAPFAHGPLSMTGYPDGSRRQVVRGVALAFKDAYRMLHQRIGIFTALPLRSLDQLTLQSKLKDIGRT